MIDALSLSILTGGQRRLLQIIAEEGVLGSCEEEVAAYLITRGLDDMFRAGVLSLATSPADLTERNKHG